MGLLTAVSICSSAFLLGILFTSLLWDSVILFSQVEVSDASLQTVENYYLTWWNGSVAVKSFLHAVFLSNFGALVTKFAKYTDNSFFFSGASIILLIFTSGLYITVTLPYIRVLSLDPMTASLLPRPTALIDTFSRLQNFFTSGNSGPLGDAGRAAAARLLTATPMTRQARFEHIGVLCAANTIAGIFLLGVLILQIGEWYVEETVVRPAEVEARKYESEIKAVEEEKKTQ